MKTVQADVIDCLIAECPYCGKEVREDGSSLADVTAFDFESEGELECSHCDKTFNYTLHE